MIKKRAFTLTITLIVFFLVFSALFLVFIFDLDHRILSRNGISQDSEAIKIVTGWQYRWGEKPDPYSSDEGWIDFKYPGRPSNPQKNKSIQIKAPLPNTNIENASFRFRAPQQSVNVYLEDQLIYSYGSFDRNEKVRTEGSVWHFAYLPPDFAGKAIYIETFTPFAHYTGYLTQIALGNEKAQYLDIFKSNIVYFIYGFIFMMIGMGIIIIRVFGHEKWRDLVYLGLAALSIGGWYIADSSLLQLLFDMPVSAIYLSNYFIFLTPVWLLIYFSKTLQSDIIGHRQLINIQCVLYATLATAAFTLDMANLVSSLYFDQIFTILLLISTGYFLFIIVIAAAKGRRDFLPLLSGILALGLTGILDGYVMIYYTSPEQPYTKSSYIGMFYFMVVLLVYVVKNLKSVYQSLELSYKENEKNYNSLFNNMIDGFTYNRLDYDSNGHIASCTILETNNSFAKNTGLTSEALIGVDLFTIYPSIRGLSTDCIRTFKEDSDEISSLHYTNAVSEEAAASDQKLRNDAIRLDDKWFRISAFSPKQDYLCIIFSDITMMKEAEDTIRRQSYSDVMTGFYSRPYFEETMVEMNSMLDLVAPLSIIAIDIDGLKITNDTFGHDAGDNLLKKAAAILTEVFDQNTSISRIGGDEFCIILPNTKFSEAQEKAEQIVKATEAFNSRKPMVPISMSVGVASSGDDSNEDIYSIYRRADDEMYRYKMSQTSSEKSKVIDMLLTALSEKDYVSQGHVERISELCKLMAESMKLRDKQARNLVLLSKVHDVGKIGVPDEILNKPTKLSHDEYDIMKLHVKTGYNIASRSRELVTIAPLILHHHEHWDGKGYPDSLKEREIPLECRILAIVDSFDAMTNDRPYHKGMSVEEALNEIEECAGTQFDPELAKHFVKNMRRSWAKSIERLRTPRRPDAPSQSGALSM
ncbi:MAG: diguanylate cyclase [Clostridiaceae bacterium]|nr:diguanylate cyclase [Clostridiaceae bacterium]